MQVSRFSVHRPVFTVMLMLIIVLLGGISLLRLPIDLMPDITYPTLAVSCSYSNASPAEIEQLITRPLEQAMSAVAGVEEVTSTSMEGRSTVRISFAWGTNLDAAANDIRDRLDRVIGRLPDDASRPTLGKFDPAAFPILILGVSGDLDLLEMRRMIDDRVKYRIERVPGVASLDLWGGREREIQVNFFADKIKALGLSLDRIVSQIRSGNKNLPGGTLERGNLEVTVRTPGEFNSLDELRNTVIATREGALIRLSEIAAIEDTTSRNTRVIRIDGKPGIYVAIQKQSGTNTVEVARKVHEEIERINRDIPQIRLIPIIDTSGYIERSITNVGRSALYGGVLAIFVLLFFLRNIPSTVVIATAIPISIVATFALMYFGGFTLNIMTLGGLALGVGMMVDSSIVVLENISRLRESGSDSLQAAIHGSEEVTAAIIAGTLTTLAVFLPLIFVQGMAGVMFKQLAYVIGFSLLCSLFVALTLVPMLSSRLHKPVSLENGSKDHLIYRATERIFRQMENAYSELLDFALSHRMLIVLGAVSLIGGSLLLTPLLGVEFMPTSDEGEVRVTVEMETGTRLEILENTVVPLERIVRETIPEAKTILTTIGGSHWRGGRRGQIRVTLPPANERERSSEELAAILHSRLTGIPGVKIRTRAGQGLFLLRMGTSGDNERIQLEIRGYDLQTADALGQQLRQTLLTVDGITDVRLSRESGNPEELIVIDRLKAADMNLTVSQIAEMLKTVMRGTVATYYREQGDEFPILVKLHEGEKIELQELLDLTIANSAGEAVVLRNVVHVSTQTGPTRIERKNQERIATVSANTSGERDMGHLVADIRERLRSIPVPRDFSIVFAGDVEEQRKAFKELLLSLVLALALVYMVMASLYESLRDPFVVMFSVPLAIVGVVLMLFLTDTTFNVQSFIGCIMLGGIVVNNAILLVDHINLLRRRDGLKLRAAIEEAGRHRLRPILMTSMTTMLALSPLAFGLGEGAEAQAPLARAVIGGLFSSTLITLIFIPVIYSVFEASLRKTQSEG